jgi:Zn-finger nucleic acid-binding protein
MICPDCKVEMETISHNYIGEAIEPYYKCPKCLIEIGDDDE